jgi:pilus assembly protein CpaC
MRRYSARHLIAAALLTVNSWMCAVSASAEELQGAQVAVRGAAGTAPHAGRDVLELSWAPIQASGSAGSLPIVRGRSQVIRFDRDAVRTAVSDPQIFDIVPISSREVLINAKASGSANLIAWDEFGQAASYRFDVTIDTERLAELLRRVDPGAEVLVVPFKNSAAVYANTSTADSLKKFEMITKAYEKDSLSFVGIRDPKQVLLEVRFAEINRRDNADFKLDAEMLTRFIAYRSMTGQTGASGLDGLEIDGVYPRGSNFSKDGYGVFSSNQITQSVGNLALTYMTQGVYVTPVLKWLEQRNVLKIIARPNLIAKDGEEAEFLVGGEFAVPVANDGDISVNYKEYGTRLKFKPDVLGGDRVKLTIDTEVSELDYTNTVTISSTTVPSILKRRQTTVAELGGEQSLVIGGIITQRISRQNFKMPLLGDVPVLGQLFRSESFTRTDVELIIVITPHLIEPIDLGEKKVLYEPESVKEAIRMVYPPYADPQGDAVNGMIRGQEEFTDFDSQNDYRMHETGMAFKKATSRPAAASAGSAAAPGSRSHTPDQDPGQGGVFPSGKIFS